MNTGSTLSQVLLLITAIFIVAPTVGLSYEIGPKKKVHETLTLMAVDCVRTASRAVPPSGCIPSPASVMGQNVFEQMAVRFDDSEMGQVSATELADAVRWPDDPTKEIGVWTIVKLGLKLLSHCKKRYSGGLENGLLCSSHEGPLQFWHGMASSATEPTEATQRKMLQWAEFLYQVASNKVDLNQPYCHYWRGEEKRGKKELAAILAPEGSFPCVPLARPWKVSTLFSLTCTKPFSSKKCTELREPRVARVHALGALLHMVQDSYAQGHAGRGGAELISGSRRIRSKFECLPISQFYTYSQQDTGKHGQADAPPIAGLSCFSRSQIDNPLLAGAKVIWYVQHHQGGDSGEKLSEYLRERVFALEENHSPFAGVGEYFSKGDTP